MSIHRTHLAGAALVMLLAGAGVACGGSRAQSKAPATAAAGQATPGARAVPASPSGARPGPAPQTTPPTGEAQNQPGGPNERGDEGDAELVVSREVVARCPTLRLVREHVNEFDPDMVWLAVLESIADCMGEGGAMSTQNIGVSGDEEHRHVVREVLGSRGVAPARVVAKPPSAAGAAECQGGGTDCGKRVEITLIAQ